MIPHAMEVVRRLYPQYRMCVVTNGVVATQYARLRDSGLDAYFHHMFVSGGTDSRSRTDPILITALPD